MPTLTQQTPKYRKHKASGQAIVTIAGRDHYLGPHGTKASYREYDRLIAKWLAEGRPSRPEAYDFTVTQLLAHFWKFAKQHYRKNGESTGTEKHYGVAIKMVREHCAEHDVAEFGPKALAHLQQVMIGKGFSRRYINDMISRIKRIFKWGVAQELVDVAVYQRLATVEGLQKGRTEAKESTRVRPVSEKIVDATIPHLPDIVADMVRLQRLTGCRPVEITSMRWSEIHRDFESLSEAIDPSIQFTWVDNVWIYLPDTHKTEHHDCLRVIPIGPKGQAILKKYITEGERDSAFVFSPAKSEAIRREQMHKARTTRLSCGNKPGSNRVASPKRKPGDRYTKHSYSKAIRRACESAFPISEEASEHEIEAWKKKYYWAPNRLRHATGTEVRRLYGIETAQALLGHSRLNTTEIYAERKIDQAIQVMKEIG